MLGTLLQTDPGSWSAARTAVQVGELLGAVLGLFIAYQAYRGYRRNDSKPMLFIAAGFTLILGAPIPLFAAHLLFSVGSQVYVQGVIQAVELVGLACIVYALRV
jgi:hypothetical protein